MYVGGSRPLPRDDEEASPYACITPPTVRIHPTPHPPTPSHPSTPTVTQQEPNSNPQQVTQGVEKVVLQVDENSIQYTARVLEYWVCMAIASKELETPMSFFQAECFKEVTRRK